MLPTSLDSESLQRIAIGVLIGLAVLSLLIMRFVQKMAMRLLLLALVIGLGIGVWAQRAEFQQCAKTCNCRLFGKDVRVPTPRCDDSASAIRR